MIQEGLEYSYLTNGIARVPLRVPQDEPTTLYYFFCDPHNEVNAEGDITSQVWKTSVARVLCLCLLAFRSPIREQKWRNRVSLDLHKWKTNFDHTRSEITREELQQIPHSDSTNPDFPSPESGSSYGLPSSSPLPSPSEGRRVPTDLKTAVHLRRSGRVRGRLSRPDLTAAFLLAVVAPTVPRSDLLARNMVIRLSAKAPLQDCGKKSLMKHRYIKSCGGLKDLPCLYFWEPSI